jgi:hypothetical protein
MSLMGLISHVWQALPLFTQLQTYWCKAFGALVQNIQHQGALFWTEPPPIASWRRARTIPRVVVQVV